MPVASSQNGPLSAAQGTKNASVAVYDRDMLARPQTESMESMKHPIVRRMPAICAALAVLALLLVSLKSAEARPRPRASKFTANKQFGIGIMFGAPTGLSGKYFFSTSTALDFGIGAVRRWANRDGLHLHMDVLWHPAVLVNAQPFVMPFYVGVGGRIFDYDDNNQNDDLALGVRVPLGIALDFNNVPLDIFFEAVFVFDFINRGPGFDDYLNGAIGIRYYFN